MSFYISKKLILGSLLMISTSSFALAANYKGEPQPCPALPSLNDGFYVGLQGGYDSYRVKQTDTDGVSTASTSMNPTGWVGGLFAGYGMDFNQFYLGGEAFINDSSASSTNSFNNSTSSVSGSQKLSVQQSYGLALIPGIKFTPTTLTYIRLGYNWAHLKASASVSGTGIDDYSASASHTSSGFNYGVGIETLVPQLSDHVSLRAEYSHTSYSNFTPGGGDLKFSPSDNQFMLGIIYHV